MAATRSRVGIPQAFLSLPYRLSGYLFRRHPNKSVAYRGSLCAFDIGEQIPEPLRFRERDPLPTVRSCPHPPVALPNKHPPIERRFRLAFEQAPDT
jgi:hypothetical protein